MIAKLGKGRPRKFNKDEALLTAMQLFWKHGFEGVSINMLAGTIGINVPSLYAAFGNKEELFYKAVSLYNEIFGQQYDKILELPTARAAAKALLINQIDLIGDDKLPEGCFLVQTALVTSPNAEKQSAFMANLRKANQDKLVKRFERAIIDGDLPTGTDSTTLAIYIITIKHGIAVQAKTGANRDELYKLVDTALAVFP